MQYANGQEAKNGDLIVFTDNSSSKDYDAVGIVVDAGSQRNVRPLARVAGKVWGATGDHVTCVALETAMPIPNFAGAMKEIVKPEEITSCTKQEFRPGRALALGVCERCGKMAHDHPWKQVEETPEPVPAQEPAPNQP